MRIGGDIILARGIIAKKYIAKRRGKIREETAGAKHETRTRPTVKHSEGGEVTIIVCLGKHARFRADLGNVVGSVERKVE